MEENFSSLFFGRYETALDEKARLNLPARLRRMLPDGPESTLMLTPGSDGCIVIFTISAYSNFWKKISDNQEFSMEKVKWLQRVLGEKTVSIKLDKQGRFVIPQHLLHHASVKTDLLIIGVQDRIEIWNAKVYEEYLDSHDISFDTLSKELGI